MHIVLLSGGSGTRLWPLSNDARSKQFLKVLRDKSGDPQSMVQRTFEKISAVVPGASITIATCESQASSIESQLRGSYSVVVEPERRDTAPAIMLACAHLAYEQKVDPDASVVVLPIDAFADDAYYEALHKVDASVRSCAADITLLGVAPALPSEKYGYIVPGPRGSLAHPVSRFVEKPGRALAEDLIEQGALWNCGVFGFKLSYLLEISSRYSPEASFEGLCLGYGALPENSFDYEVIEKAASVAVVPYEGRWKDLGTWNTLTEEMCCPCSGRVVVDEASCSNVHVVNETGLSMVVSGLSDSVVVATPDGILVSGKEESAHIKELVGKASESRPMYETRQWGEYRVLDMSAYPDGRKSLVKELVVKQGRQLSYQKHRHRSEVWTVVSGTGEVVLGGKPLEVSTGSVIDVAPGQLHAAKALTDMRIIEVQLGGALEEGDIERFGYFWDKEQ